MSQWLEKCPAEIRCLTLIGKHYKKGNCMSHDSFLNGL